MSAVRLAPISAKRKMSERNNMERECVCDPSRKMMPPKYHPSHQQEVPINRTSLDQPGYQEDEQGSEEACQLCGSRQELCVGGGYCHPGESSWQC